MHSSTEKAVDVLTFFSKTVYHKNGLKSSVLTPDEDDFTPKSSWSWLVQVSMMTLKVLSM